MLSLIIFLPLIAFFSGCLFGRFLGYGVCIVTTFSVFFSFLLSCFLFIDIISTSTVYKMTLFPWIVSDSLFINWSFCFDSLTSVMLIVVTCISTLVHIYSTEYMSEDPHLFRFMSYLSLFTFFMLILITSSNFLQLFLGWEGVGLASYLLINFWFTRLQANKSAIKAMLVNRVGDVFLLFAIFTIYFICDSLDFDIVFATVPLFKSMFIQLGFVNFKIIDIICLFLFLGACGKSAQLGLHSWLPDAMEGPTPVSALIHAATMVTAGIFLIIRCSFLFEYSPLVLNIIVIFGCLTAFFAATTGLFQNDIKRVIAYSTCSQLGYMTFACGLSGYDIGIFHLSNHAFFKALLFLGAGSIIHAMSDEQDMRKMGGLRQILPFSYAGALIGSLALIGFPFLSGFYSKDVIIEIAYAKSTLFGHFAYYLGLLAAFCTAFYSTRLLILVFLSKPNGNRIITLNAHEGSFAMCFPLLILSILSICVGFLSREFFIGFGTNFWYNSIFILPQNYNILDIEFLPLLAKVAPLFYTFAGIFFAINVYAFNLKTFFNYKKTYLFNLFYNFLNRKWYFDKCVNIALNNSILTFSYNFTYQSVDRGLIEKTGPWGVVNEIKRLSTYIKSYQTGYLYNYLITMIFITFVFFICFVFFSTVKVPISFMILILFFCLFYGNTF